MIKRLIKNVAVCGLALVLAATTAITAAPIESKAAHEQQARINSSDVLAAGWRANGDTYTYNYSLRIGSLTGANRKYEIDQPYTPVFDSGDNYYLNGVASNAIDGVGIDAINGFFYIYTAYDLSSYAGKTGTITIENAGSIKLDWDPGTAGAGLPYATFQYVINFEVVDEGSSEDPISREVGWKTRDGGQSYSMDYDTYQLGEGYQGQTIPVALPRISATGYFDNDAIVADNSNWTLLKDIRVDTNRNLLYLTFVDNLTPVVGRSTTVTLSKSVYNERGVYAKYTLNFNIRCTNLSNALVNGKKGPSTVTVNQGESNAVRVTNVSNLSDAVVHWTTDSSGYVDVSNMSSYPKISSNGYIDTANLPAGTYYFYLRVAGNLETRTFTLIVSGKQTPAPTPVPTPTPTGGKVVYRLLNPSDNEHLYTTDTNEVAVLSTRGWRVETSPGTGGGTLPVYRLYNPNSREHLYTQDTNEVSILTSRGWNQDNNGLPIFNGFTTGSKPVYRLYNAKAPQVSSHHYTSDTNEIKSLTASGWTYDNNALPVYYLQ